MNQYHWIELESETKCLIALEDEYLFDTTDMRMKAELAEGYTKHAEYTASLMEKAKKALEDPNVASKDKDLTGSVLLLKRIKSI